MSLYPLLKPLLFSLDAETAHRLILRGIGLAAKFPGFLSIERSLFGYSHPSLAQKVWGLDFSNPVGLAAGFDKDGMVVNPMLGLGFGYVEIGTVTPRPQPGNPRPRLFRLPAEKALINRMGFNNLGALHLADRLRRVKRKEGIVGVNLGKNLDTPLEEAVADYLTGLHALYHLADYLVVNLSSPNTPGLRTLQERKSLEVMAGLLCRERDKLREASGSNIPFLIKISPDLSEEELQDIVAVSLDTGIDGIIATNTTTRREGISDKNSGETGGLSGKPLHAEALRTISELYRLSQGKLPLIGVGGIFDANDAYQFVRAGASLVQIYSGLIYQGPALPGQINRGLVKLLARDGFANISEAVGSDVEVKPVKKTRKKGRKQNGKKD